MESRRDQDGVKMKSSCVKMDRDKIGSTWGAKIGLRRWGQDGVKRMETRSRWGGLCKPVKFHS